MFWQQIHQRIDAIRNSSPCDVSTTEQNIEQAPQIKQPLYETETSVTFHVKNYGGRVKIGYIINNHKQTYKYFTYTQMGVDTVHNNIGGFTNNTNSTYGLDVCNVIWDGWNFTLNAKGHK